eukprot:s3643_g2.t1
MTLLGFAAIFMVWRRIRAIEINAGHLEVQVAQDDTLIGQHMQAIPQLQQSFDHLHEQSTEYSQHMEMLSDSVDGIHFGLAQLGGFAQHRELTPQARRRMFEIERGNVVAMNAMGSAQYLNVVRQQSRGYADTDPVVEEDDGEDGEASDPEEDQLLDPEGDLSTRAGELTTTVDDAELNQALAAEDWNDAEEILQTPLQGWFDVQGDTLATQRPLPGTDLWKKHSVAELEMCSLKFQRLRFGCRWAILANGFYFKGMRATPTRMRPIRRAQSSQEFTNRKVCKAGFKHGGLLSPSFCRGW